MSDAATFAPARRRSRVLPRVVLMLAVVASPVWFASVAGAGITNFSLSPTSGPAGTVVSVNGSGCASGLVLSSALDYVQIAATTVPPISAHIAVAANGAWSGTFTVPANAVASPAVVTAICTTDGLPSLLTIYLPKTFTVTATAPTIPTTTPTTVHPTLPTLTTPTTHKTTTTIGPFPTTTVDNPNRTTTSRPAVGTQPGGPQRGGNESGGSPSAGTSPTRHSNTTVTQRSTKHAETRARTADLDAPNLLLADDRAGGSSLAWFPWLLLLIVLGATVGLWWYRTRRHSDDAELVDTPAPSQ